MTDPQTIAVATAALAGLAMMLMATLAAWRGWLQLKHRELTASDGGGGPAVGSRIEIADLRERVRKLEAIAAGVDL